LAGDDKRAAFFKNVTTNRNNLCFRIIPKEIEMSTHRFFSLFVVLTVAVLFALVPQAVVFAGQSVDPATLNPPPPPQFNPVCKAVGFGTLCTIEFVELEGPDVTDIICGNGPNSFNVVFSATRTVTGRRYYDENGDLTQRHFREVFVGTFTNPLTGVSLDFVQADTVLHNLAVPGDTSTGTEAITGSTRFSLPEGGAVLIDAGRTVLDASDGTILFEAGQHHFDDYFGFGDSSALKPLCDALE
jgi:hypothetical protein